MEQNPYILVRDPDWKKIFSDIEEHEDAFARYYPMVRLKVESERALKNRGCENHRE